MEGINVTKLVISTLGPLEITTAHASGSGFLSDKVRALLVYLALEADRPLRRETLAALLWPGQPEKKARANLRRALANCRQVIDDEDAHYLHITRQTLQFNRAADAIIDAVQFEQLLSDAVPGLAEMEKAVALVRGPFWKDSPSATASPLKNGFCSNERHCSVNNCICSTNSLRTTKPITS